MSSFRLLTLLVFLASECCQSQSRNPGPNPPPRRPPQPCAADTDGLYKVSDFGMKGPELIYKEDPAISREIRRKTTGAVVTVQLTVNTKGKPENVHILTSSALDLEDDIALVKEVDQRSINSVKQYPFIPATCNGTAAPVMVNVEINF